MAAPDGLTGALAGSQHDGKAASQAMGRASGRGRRHGTSSSEPYDRWFRYPAGFASDYAELLLGSLQIPVGSTVVDPFCGSGVTGTAARNAGYGFYGIEAHPLIAELAQIKLAPPPEDPSLLLTAAREAVAAVSDQLQTAESKQVLAKESDLVRRCFDQSTLLRLTLLREFIKTQGSNVWRTYLKWALLGVLRDVASSRVGWPYQRPSSPRIPRFKDALARFEGRAAAISADLSIDYPRKVNARLAVVCGDATEFTSWTHMLTERGNACVSSPPYLNNFDYADATRLELYFWGEISTWAEMCRDVRSSMITATTQQSSVTRSREADAQLSDLEVVGKEIKEVVKKLRLERLARPRGKEYDRVIPDYFVGIMKCLQNLHRRLDSDAPVALLVGDSAPYGVYVDTPRLIAQLGEAVGFAWEGDSVLRRRGLRWANNSGRHDVALSERLILLRSRPAT